MASPTPVDFIPAAIAAVSGVGALVVSRRKSSADADETMVETAQEVVKMVKESMADELKRVNEHLRRCEAENVRLNERIEQLEAAHR